MQIFMAITMKDNSVYETSSLSSFQRSVEPDQNNENSMVNIFQDAESALPEMRDI